MTRSDEPFGDIPSRFTNTRLLKIGGKKGLHVLFVAQYKIHIGVIESEPL